MKVTRKQLQDMMLAYAKQDLLEAMSLTANWLVALSEAHITRVSGRAAAKGDIVIKPLVEGRDITIHSQQPILSGRVKTDLMGNRIPGKCKN